MSRAAIDKGIETKNCINMKKLDYNLTFPYEHTVIYYIFPWYEEYIAIFTTPFYQALVSCISCLIDILV